eukprot:CAMPEP_0172572938 /NCGR_PEP_ID=MMETSP1067-20121228/135935_1 /TAXON_ID=265564 ORGANISM="Thalassiosira punctigera, Strain Tpunct2005C2" /NCGR_SAMPLE_ID=MMETSP1067 /ASSEMBLY_ACC=CAM_ASM_000444 /LENGTH=224 /DNA_ID=CAMNT_0013365529 /DNA_START=60 /DNA_END=734 /DNA_ORIENTATION=+
MKVIALLLALLSVTANSKEEGKVPCEDEIGSVDDCFDIKEVNATSCMTCIQEEMKPGAQDSTRLRGAIAPLPLNDAIKACTVEGASCAACPKELKDLAACHETPDTKDGTEKPDPCEEFVTIVKQCLPTEAGCRECIQEEMKPSSQDSDSRGRPSEEKMDGPTYEKTMNETFEKKMSEAITACAADGEGCAGCATQLEILESCYAEAKDIDGPMAEPPVDMETA